ncbi:MAG: hypothetical protein AAGJ18_05930, partial [Bacteroidota bacterium]
MKSLNIKFPFTTSDLLGYFDRLTTSDLQGIADKLALLIAKRNEPNQEDREKELVKIISERLPTVFMNRFG